MKLAARVSLIGLLASALAIDTHAQSWSPLDVGGFAALSSVPDEAAVRRLMRQQAEAGDVRAMIDYAALLRDTSGTMEEGMRFRAEAERLDRAAAERGDPLGQANAGVWCMKNLGVRTLAGACQSDVEAVRWFRLAMDQGDGRGTAFYGYMVEFGRGGLEKDPQLAARYYGEARKRGSFYGSAFLSDMKEYADRAPRGRAP